MNKILNRWYFGLIIVPVLINYLTDFINLPDLLNNWYLTIILSQSIVILILSYELFSIRNLIKKPSSRDKKIIVELLETLDIQNIQYNLIDQDGWNGYKKDSIRRLTEFTFKASNLNYSLSNKKLASLISELNEAIIKFSDYSSGQLYDDSDHYYIPDKKSEMGYQKATEARPIMNQQTKVIFDKLSRLMEFLKKRNYLD